MSDDEKVDEGYLDSLIRNSASEEQADQPDVVANSPQSEPPNNNDGLEIAELEVGGVIRDAYGNTWQVPGDNVEDLDDLYAGDIYKIPPEMEKVFHVQMIRLDQVKEYAMRGFIPVLQEELGIPKQMIKDNGQPLDRYHCVGDAVMVKIPRVIYERIKAKEDQETRRRLMELEPTPEMLKKAGVDSGLMVEHHLGFTGADPAKRPGIYADEQGRVK